MKKVSIFMAGLLLSAATTFAQTWTVDKAHARVGFTITHLMVNDVDGMFKSYDATIVSAKPDFSDAVFSFTAETNSVFTDNEKRDAHLQSPDFFDAQKNPQIAFKSKSVKKAGNGALKLSGDLTMHGVTKPVTFDVTFRGPAEHPMTKKQVAGFKATGKVKRSDFGIGGNMPSAMLSDEVVITANGEFQKG
jgi:polyisoprenoid-binding protein YceI